MKKVLSLTLALILLLSAFPLQAYAASSNSDEYFRLYPSNTRINDSGIFDFKFSSYVFSDKNFIATSPTIHLEMSAVAYDNSTQSIIADYAATYILELYKTGISSPIGHLQGITNGNLYTIDFNVNTGGEYYFKIYAIEPLGGSRRIKGTGDISNIYTVPANNRS